MNEKYGPNKLRGPCSVFYNDMADSPAFNAARPLCQLLVAKAKRFYNRTTQKAIPVSARIVAKLVKTNKDMGLSLMNEAIHYGFWRRHTAGHLSSTGKGIATFVQLADEMFEGKPATLDFLKWDGTPFCEQKSPSYYKRRERGLAELEAHKAKLIADEAKNNGTNDHKKTKPRPVRKDTPVPDVQDTPVPDVQTPSPKSQQFPVPDVQDISKNALHLTASPLDDGLSIPTFLQRGHPDCFGVKE